MMACCDTWHQKCPSCKDYGQQLHEVLADLLMAGCLPAANILKRKGLNIKQYYVWLIQHWQEKNINHFLRHHQ